LFKITDLSFRSYCVASTFSDQGFIQPFVSGSMKLSGDDRLAEGHESRREAPGREGSGEGVPLPRDGGPGVSPLDNFEI